ncbi:hypothetical protein BGW38_002756 [Lunasporangiospora selenospora]|uniref:MYND-type domain-containing protein n=1 Tax=Lunasporangiospora selenospora TaxID=979761 RepID=A0A9P6KDB8_9FUNG|nr:hypothetical protein BGW38_002756 [Lunasporangiospora selenospora]
MTSAQKCAKCSKTTGEGGNALKRCAKCKTVLYCSRTCQTADWKVHKKSCGLSAGVVDPIVTIMPQGTFNTLSGKPLIAKGLEGTIDKPFTQLYNKTWLHDRSEKDVFQLLVDCFRLKLEDDYKFEGDVPVDSLYSGNCADSRIPFRAFLKKAEKRDGLLPPWWKTAEGTTKLDECVTFGLTDSWANLGFPAEKGDMIQHYNDANMPMQLRMLSEQITGRGPMGQSGMEMLRMQMSREGGKLPYMSTIDMSRVNELRK